MTQKLMYLLGADDQLAAVEKRLVADGFRVTPSQRLAGGIMVRVRTESNDEATVNAVIAALGPDLEQGPAGAPVNDIVGYREGK